ncbi:MgtC/SapB family protein [Maritimibacter dapengensis]|uniref:Protein MgtC n=1 Tax=Maritimibacter dapengensis TaxID=2836868 RepID=A0ABS6T2X9_9RHOB|nr:MgtC/SapB family protein [Maritimibacter dapengensis]MBV7378916.1 MgtC/SapB family protein [Maritimibacter dapengensis]
MEIISTTWAMLWEASTLPPGTIALRIFVAAVLGGIIGLEREMIGRPAGLRTHMLISTAAAVFAMVTLELFEAAVGRSANADPIRVIEAVTAGVAFIAAGAIFRDRGDGVKGLTTGAGLWAAGAIGTAVGAGYIALAIMAFVVVFVINAVVRLIEKKLL